jgi:hypothetical protein
MHLTYTFLFLTLVFDAILSVFSRLWIMFWTLFLSFDFCSALQYGRFTFIMITYLYQLHGLRISFIDIVSIQLEVRRKKWYIELKSPLLLEFRILSSTSFVI